MGWNHQLVKHWTSKITTCAYGSWPQRNKSQACIRHWQTTHTSDCKQVLLPSLLPKHLEDMSQDQRSIYLFRYYIYIWSCLVHLMMGFLVESSRISMWRTVPFSVFWMDVTLMNQDKRSRCERMVRQGFVWRVTWQLWMTFFVFGYLPIFVEQPAFWTFLVAQNFEWPQVIQGNRMQSYRRKTMEKPRISTCFVVKVFLFTKIQLHDFVQTLN